VECVTTSDAHADPSVQESMAADGLVVDAAVQRGDFRLAVSFAVGPGEVLGVLGPNGAGKTTLLRVLAGLTAATSGSIRLDHELLTDVTTGVFLPPERRPVGLLFQNYRLFPHLSVRDNVAFAPRCQGIERRAANAIAHDWLVRFGLADYAKRKPDELSGGQAQRVALARALAANPGLLLLDEPLSALDARTRLEVRAELRRHLAEFAGPTLFVTHDPLEALMMADRLLVLEDGRIVQQGPPAAVARRPATNYVARLVGVNLYRGLRANSSVIALHDGGSLIAAGFDDSWPGEAIPVLVAVRPNAIVLHESRPEHASARNVWPGTVTGLEPLTDRVRLEVAGTPGALVDVTPEAVAELRLSEGRSVWLSVKATEVDVYPDPAT
jgi:molybdate transport system ATP-binding protein